MRSGCGVARAPLEQRRRSTPLARERTTIRPPARRRGGARRRPRARTGRSSSPGARRGFFSSCSAVAAPTAPSTARPKSRDGASGASEGASEMPGSRFSRSSIASNAAMRNVMTGMKRPRPAPSRRFAASPGVDLVDQPGDRRGGRGGVADAVGLESDVHHGPLRDQLAAAAVEQVAAVGPVDRGAQARARAQPRVDRLRRERDQPAVLALHDADPRVVGELAEPGHRPRDPHAAVARPSERSSPVRRALTLAWSSPSRDASSASRAEEGRSVARAAAGVVAARPGGEVAVERGLGIGSAAGQRNVRRPRRRRRSRPPAPRPAARRLRRYVMPLTAAQIVGESKTN